MKLNSEISAIVTGGASGLGEATARALATKGVKTAIFDLNEDAGAKLEQEIGVKFVKCDISNEESVTNAFKIARETNGQERILVNCAGIVKGIKTASRDKENGEIKHFPLDVYAKVIEVNLIGTFRMIAKAAAGMMALEMIDNERGVIINTASIAAFDGQIGQAAYTASKAGVAGMSLPIARDLAGEAIRINAICPGIFNTPMMASLPPHIQDALGQSVPFPKRLGHGAEFAALALHIVENQYLNGENIRLDGAIRLGMK